MAEEADRALGRLQQLEDAVPGRRLAGAGLADEPERLARVDLEGDVVDRLDVVDGLVPEQALLDREVLLQPLDLEQRLALDGRLLLGHLRCRRGRHDTPTGAPLRSDAGCALRTQCPGRISRSSGATTLQSSVPAYGQRGAKRQASGGVEQVRRPAGNRGQAPLPDPLALDLRKRGEQRLGVRVLGRVEQVERRRLLDELPGVHDDDVVGRLGDDAHVVGDDDHRHVELIAELVEEVEDAGLHGHVERGRRLVGDQQLRVAGERDRDHHALTHASRVAVRIVVEAGCRVRDVHLVEQLDRALPRLGALHLQVALEHLGDLRPDPERRVQRGHRILEDHRDLPAADVLELGLLAADQLAAVEHHRAADDLPGRLRRCP